MTLEQQVCSLEWAKRLKELGVKQESLFAWLEDYESNPDKVIWTLQYNPLPERMNYECSYSAFTVAELGEMLPTDINVPLLSGRKRKDPHHITYAIWNTYAKRKYKCGLNHHSAIFYHNEYDDSSEANSRAKMLIYLLENKLITL